MTRNIAVFTGTRAEYGLLSPLMKALAANKNLGLQVIVSGAHLSPTFGETWQQIEADGFPIAAKIDMQLGVDTPVGIAKSMALCLAGCAEALAELQPDILVVLGDRYETLAAAEAAMLARIPIAHIHGGESTEGAIDEAIRHAITKMSHLHFVATEDFKKRVIQLGESPDRVWVVGATGLDTIAALPNMAKTELESALGLTLKAPVFLVTYHPETLRKQDSAPIMRDLLTALDEKNGTIIITGVNADAGNAPLRDVAKKFVTAHKDRATLVENLGAVKYLNLMRFSDLVIGNSSSGLLEAPSMGIPSVDIGDRQKGRPRAPSVLHAVDDKESIAEAITRALSYTHKKIAAAKQTPYGIPGAAARMEKILAGIPLANILKKTFYNLP
jgi:UDP-hydrolysing UDP-N-acetyl-D-glucosamine 2-epimerase